MRVLLLPSVPYEPLWRLHAAGEHPKPTVTAELRQIGIEIDSIDPDTGWKNPFGRMHPFPRAFDPLRAVRAVLRHRRYDLIVSGNDGAAAVLTEARALLRFRTPIVVWDFSPAVRWRMRIAAQDRMVPRLDGILALNELQIPYVAQRWGSRPSVTVVGHWVDTAFYTPRPGEPGDAILAVGDDAGRDYPTLLRALEGLTAATLIRTALPLSRTDQHGAVTILGQRLSAPAFRDLYAASKFVVVPLRHDNANASGVSTILEAAAMGKAVIASDSDAVREFVRHGETGLVVPANDPAALRGAIDRLLADPAACARLGAGGRRFAERTAAPDVFAARLAAAFRTFARMV